MPNCPLIKLDHVHAGYDGKTVLHDVSLTLSQNEFAAVIGPNGGGKTTLVKLLLGLIPATAGRIVRYDAEGNETNRLPIGYLPQYTAFDPKFPMSVLDVVLSGLHQRKQIVCRFSQADRDEAAQVLELVGLGNDDYRRSFGSLSGGQRQRVLIARALICQPRFLILDEPSTYIDRQNQDNLYQMLKRLSQRCAILVVGHDISAVLQAAHSVVCVDRHVQYFPTVGDYMKNITPNPI